MSFHTSAYCPTQRSYTMSLSNAAYQTSIGGGVSGYQSLYSEQRRDLDVLEVRMETFIFYPKSSISTADIAAAGFYYTGEGYVVRCFCCKLTVTRLNDGDNPFAVHRSQAPNCPFVRKTLAQDGVPVERRGEDTVDGGSDSALPADVEVDGALEDDVVPRGLSKRDDRTTTTTNVKPLRRAAPLSKHVFFYTVYLRTCKFSAVHALNTTAVAVWRILLQMNTHRPNKNCLWKPSIISKQVRIGAYF